MNVDITLFREGPYFLRSCRIIPRDVKGKPWARTVEVNCCEKVTACITLCQSLSPLFMLPSKEFTVTFEIYQDRTEPKCRMHTFADFKLLSEEEVQEGRYSAVFTCHKPAFECVCDNVLGVEVEAHDLDTYTITSHCFFLKIKK